MGTHNDVDGLVEVDHDAVVVDDGDGRDGAL